MGGRGGGALTHSEVGSRQRVGGAAVLADDGGGVALLAVVVAAAPHAGQLADGGREDHLDAARVVAHCARTHDTSQEQTGEERRPSGRVGDSPVHRGDGGGEKKKKNEEKKRRRQEGKTKSF